MLKSYAIQILVDNDSWIIPYAKNLVSDLTQKGHISEFISTQAEIRKGDILAMLGCVKRVPQEFLLLHTHNLVVHASDLPQGKGFSPLSWQILEGKNEIPVTLFEAEDEIDAGAIYFKDTLHFKGHELISEMREVLGQSTIGLIKTFVDKYPNLPSIPQIGETTIYPRRRPENSELDIHKSIEDQFNLLRIVDNEQYPAFFNYLGHQYILKIEKKSDV